MKNMNSRKADPSEFDQFFMMGHDVWGEGTELEYLTACRNSTKYARGTWYVMETAKGELASSFIIYRISKGEYGIGSIATPKSLRKQGHATQLLLDILKEIEVESPRANLFLYSDIEPAFYERFGLARIPQEAQRYKTTTCMVRGKDVGLFTDKMKTPEYF